VPRSNAGNGEQSCVICLSYGREVANMSLKGLFNRRPEPLDVVERGMKPTLFADLRPPAVGKAMGFVP